MASRVLNFPSAESVLLNWTIGSAVDVDGAACILTHPGVAGHAVFGDYHDYPAGNYAVEFQIAPIAGQAFDPDQYVAEVDAVLGNDTIQLARRGIHLSDLTGGTTRFVLTFRLDEPGRLQFRVGVNGVVPLVIADARPLVRLTEESTDVEPLLAHARFPDIDRPDAPPFLVEHREVLRRLHSSGFGVRVQDGDVVLDADGVSFLARVADDLNFVQEIFFEQAYNIGTPGDACVIDIGMNSGLVTLLMARRDVVKEVHAFEPFAETHARACANIAINPHLAEKITTYQVALADHDVDGTFLVRDERDSGSMSIRTLGEGVPADLRIRDAAGMLGPIIAAAAAKGRQIIVKVDCEGSEFAIFESLEKAGLLEQVTAFMVEWHRVFDGKSQATLIDPLLRRGFVTFDRSPKTGNGFFYAVAAMRA
ncbi:FkbM family methyltransferase [Sphingomonas arantia]|uniref:FkbM family methyltransferase n=1 Tax=Sphingomonas arantia TaxID=1460676 RepID=A0ABW4TX68_9SPHN